MGYAVVLGLTGLNCGIYILLSDNKHRFVQKVHSARANGHWECRRNSNPVDYVTTCRCCIVCSHLILHVQQDLN